MQLHAVAFALKRLKLMAPLISFAIDPILFNLASYKDMLRIFDNFEPDAKNGVKR